MQRASTTGSTIGALGLANAAAARIPSALPHPLQQLLDIFIVRDFLDERECARADRADRRATACPRSCSPPTADPEFRTSDSCNLDPDDPTRAAGRGQDHQPDGHRSRRMARPSRASATRSASSSSRITTSSTTSEPYWDGDDAQRRPADLDGDGLPQRRPRAAARPISPRPASRSRRGAAICSPGTIWTRSAQPNTYRDAPGLPGHRRHQIYHHQMVSRAALGLYRTSTAY